MKELEVSTVGRCSVNCEPYCPQGKLAAHYDGPYLLPLSDFKTAISTVPADVEISFAGFSEPFLNPAAIDMMQHARSEGHAISIFSTLVGLKPEDAARIAPLKPRRFVLHLPDNQGVAHIPVTPRYLQSREIVERTVRLFGISKMDAGFDSNERAGNCSNAKPRHVYGPFLCSKLWDPQPVLLPNCDAYLCCHDYSLQHRLGNLLRDSWEDVITGPEFRRVRAQAHRFDGDALCRTCKWATPVLSWSGAKLLKREAVRKVLT